MSSLINMITGRGNDSSANQSSSSMSSSSMGSSSSMSSGSMSSMSSGPTTTSTTGYNTNTHTQGYSNSGYGTSGAGTGTATGVAGHHHHHQHGGSMAQTGSTNMGSTTDTNIGNDGYITRSEEQLRVGKESFETGRAQLGKHVTTEHVSTTVPISKERVVVEREPISSADVQSGNLRGDIGEASYEMRLKEERAIAEKEVVPIEKVRMRKEVETTQQEVGGELRKEHIDINDGMSGKTGTYNKTDNRTDTAGTGYGTGNGTKGTEYDAANRTLGDLPTTTNTGYGTTNTRKTNY